MFDCPAYDHVRKKYDSIFQQALSVSDNLQTLSQMHVVDFSESVLHVSNPLYPPETVYSLE